MIVIDLVRFPLAECRYQIDVVLKASQPLEKLTVLELLKGPLYPLSSRKLDQIRAILAVIPFINAR